MDECGGDRGDAFAAAGQAQTVGGGARNRDGGADGLAEHLLGLVAMGYMWARIAKAALARQAEAASEAMAAKLVVGRFYMERLLPETATRLVRIKAGAETTMALSPEAF